MRLHPKSNTALTRLDEILKSWKMKVGGILSWDCRLWVFFPWKPGKSECTAPISTGLVQQKKDILTYSSFSVTLSICVRNKKRWSVLSFFQSDFDFHCLDGCNTFSNCSFLIPPVTSLQGVGRFLKGVGKRYQGSASDLCRQKSSSSSSMARFAFFSSTASSLAGFKRLVTSLRLVSWRITCVRYFSRLIRSLTAYGTSGIT